MEYKDIIDFEHLYESAMKCKNNVMWKDSTAHFMLNAVNEVSKLTERLHNKTYIPREPVSFTILNPKRREIISVAFIDRVYQRSINDNILYPTMTKSFIYDNCACQKGKGTDFARNRLKEHLHRYYRKHGNKGYVLQIDIKKYYPSMSHEKVEEMFRKKIDKDTYNAILEILHHQYKGDRGYNPGSQLIQIAGISFLNNLDHYIKEKLHIKYYVRYMDDLILIHHDRLYLEKCMQQISQELIKIKLELNSKKTRIYPIEKKIPFLGFSFSLTNTGKVVMTLKKDAIKRQKRHVRNLVRACKKGRITKEKVDECVQSLMAHAEKGNTYYYRQKFKKFYDELWR